MKRLPAILPLLLILCCAQSSSATTARATAAYLRDIHTGRDIRTLTEGATLTDASAVNFRISAADTHSMWLTLDGPAGRVQLDPKRSDGRCYQGARPWCAPGDARTIALPPGAYTLTATPYRGYSGTTGAGTKLYRHFTVSAPVPPPVTQPSTEPSTQPEPPPPPVPSGILITTASQLHSIGAKSGTYLLNSGQTYDISALGGLVLSAPGLKLNVTNPPQRAKIKFAPSAQYSNLVGVYGDDVTLDNIDYETSTNTRFISPHGKRTTIRNATFTGTLDSFLEQTSAAVPDGMTLENLYFPGAINNYFLYWQCADLLHPVYTRDWTVRNCRWNGSVNQHGIRLKGIANLIVDGGEFNAVLNKHSICNLQGVDGSTWTNVKMKGVAAVFTADENPLDFATSPLVARNIYFNGCTWDTGACG
jgi:hypothetical protein